MRQHDPHSGSAMPVSFACPVHKCPMAKASWIRWAATERTALELMQTKICDKSRCAGHDEHKCPIVHKLHAATSIIAGEVKKSRKRDRNAGDRLCALPPKQ
jgi:hypothetical protein